MADQTVCNLGDPIVPIEYTFEGGATTYNISWTGGPIGLNVLNTSSNTLTISGTVNIPGGIAATTSYTYIITTIGNNCETGSVSGVITVLPELDYIITTLNTRNQVNANALCSGEDIEDIVFEVIGGEGAAQVSLTWTTENVLNNISVTPNGTNTIWTISGSTKTVTTTTSFPYQITIYRPGSCSSPVSFDGTISVIPKPVIDQNFITLNDITNVTCVGGSDGSIIIPASPTIEFEKRISGGQLASQQVESVTISSTDALGAGDVIRVIIDGFTFDAVTGAGQTTETVLLSLAEKINTGVNSSNVDVFASVLATPELRVTADIPGIPFTISGATTLNAGTNTITTIISSVVSNTRRNYSLKWYDVNRVLLTTGYKLENQPAGEYTLEVSINDCAADTVSFTIEEPEESLTVSYTACGGTLDVIISGGTGPYNIKLYEDGVLYRQSDTPDGETYNDLVPGRSYFYEIIDDLGCSIDNRDDIITMPLGLDLDITKTRVVNDYCREINEVGGGSIELNVGNLAVSGGSGQYNYSWTGPNINGVVVTYNSMNISYLIPGRYTVTVTDDIYGCDVTQEFEVDGPELVLSVDDSGATNPRPNGDSIDLLCNGDETTISVQAIGGMFNSYIYTWYRNGVQFASGADNSLTTTQTGVYTILVEVDFPNDPNILPAQLGSINDMYCATSITYNVESPSVMAVSELNSERVIPACSNDGATLVFEVTGGSENAGPYTLSLQNGAISGSSAAAGVRRIVISDIDTNNLGAISEYTITNANGCSDSGTFTNPIILPSYDQVTFQVATTDIDCSQSQEGSVEFSIGSGTPDTNSVGIRIQSTVLNYNYFTNWANAASGGGNPTITLPRAGTYTYEILGSPVSGNTTSTALCPLGEGTFEIQDVSNGQLVLRDINTYQPGCGDETGIIELVFDEETIPPTMVVNWQKLITSTTSSSTTQNWTTLPSAEGQLTLGELENGTYRAQINGNTGGLCGVDEITTKSIVIGNTSGIRLINARYEEEDNFDICSANDFTDLRYKIKFSLVNNVENFEDGKFNVQLIKLSDYGDNYAGGDLQVSEGAVTINDVPFGEWQVVVIQSGSQTDTTLCEAIQTVVIPEIEPFEWLGESTYELDECANEATISADVTGGVPFITDNGPVYRYEWTFVTEDGDVYKYAGESVTIRQPGNISLTVYDSTNCDNGFEVNDGVAIEIRPPISEYLIQNIEIEEPTCQDPEKDDGVISFTVEGGSTPEGGQYPYEIIWEKFDVDIGDYIEQDGNNGQQNLYMQQFANTLVGGIYRISVLPLNWDCISGNTRERIGKVITRTVPQNDDLVITNGPVIDVSEYDFLDPNQLTICEPGGAGNLYVKVFNNYDGELDFYYPDAATLISKEKLDNDSYRLLIDNAVAEGELTVVNTEGCRVSRSINLEIGDPNFTYTSLNSQISGNSTETQMPLILAREEVTFNNTSEGVFTYAEWDFGDGSPKERFSSTVTSTSVTHIYGVSGTYYATLRLYNSVGCYEEIIKTVVVGKGYNILVPNVFTPNNDTYNDSFKPLFSGFSSLQMTIYDYRGNMLYFEEATADPANLTQPLIINGWDGETITDSPYYIYTINGITLFGDIEVEKSGTFIIIR